MLSHQLELEVAAFPRLWPESPFDAGRHVSSDQSRLIFAIEDTDKEHETSKQRPICPRCWLVASWSVQLNSQGNPRVISYQHRCICCLHPDPRPWLRQVPNTDCVEMHAQAAPGNCVATGSFVQAL